MGVKIHYIQISHSPKNNENGRKNTLHTNLTYPLKNNENGRKNTLYTNLT